MIIKIAKGIATSAAFATIARRDRNKAGVPSVLGDQCSCVRKPIQQYPTFSQVDINIIRRARVGVLQDACSYNYLSIPSSRLVQLVSKTLFTTARKVGKAQSHRL